MAEDPNTTGQEFDDGPVNPDDYEEMPMPSHNDHNPFEDVMESTHINKVIGVVSGKGGVGKSHVTALLASQMRREGYRVGIVDSDITGPSIPKMLGVASELYVENNAYMVPALTPSGIKIMSIGLVLPDETEPAIWRGPLVSGTIRQFWCDTKWEDIDYMFIDMPPGTGDVALTVFEQMPVDGLVIVATPQDLVEVIATKAIRMAEQMEVPIIGLVENMSYLECPHCGEKINLFGESDLPKLAEKFDIGTFCRIPMRPEFSKASDNSTLGELEVAEIQPLIDTFKGMM